MPKLPPKSDNPIPRSRAATLALVCGGFLAYWTVFFQQPSVFGFTDSGATVTRFVDLMQLFLLEQLASSLTGNGRFEIGLLDRIPVLLGGLAWIGLAWAVGSRFLMRTSFAGNLSRLESHAAGALLGLALFSTLTLVLGLAGQLTSRWTLVASMLLLGLWIAFDWSRNQQPYRRFGQRQNAHSALVDIEPRSMLALWISRLIAPLTCGLAIAYVLGSAMPPWEFDVLEYHLQAPKEFFQAGRIGFNDHNVYANMPLGTEMHTLAAMVLVGGDDGWWWGGLIGKAITGCFSLLAAMLLGGFISRQYGAWSGWTAAGLMLGTPGVAHVSMAGLIDMALATYLLGAVIVLTVAWPRLASSQFNVWDVLTISLLAGAAAACKYTGLLYAAVPVVAASGCALNRCKSGKTIAGWFAVSLLGLCLTCIPWYAKTFWQSGNPFYPLAASVFPSETLSETQVAQWQNAHRVPVSVEGGSAYSPFAWLASMQQVFLQSNFLPPSLVGLMFCGVFACWIQGRPNASRWPLAWFLCTIWILAVWWTATHRIDRFWLPVVPLWCGLACIGANWIAKRCSVGIASAIVLLSLAFGGFLSVAGVFSDNRFFVSLAALREDVGDGDYAGRLSPAIGWVNSTLINANTRILLIGEAKAFDFRPPIVYATCFNMNPAETWLRGKSVDQQKANLAAEGISHIIINWGELARYRSPGNYGFSDWPQRKDIESLIDTQVVRACASPFDESNIQVLEVVEPNLLGSAKP